MIGNLIGAFVMIILALSLWPVITGEVDKAVSQVIQEGSAPEIILHLIPLFFILGIMGVAFATAYSSLKDFGVYSNEYEEEYKDTPEEEKPHKQTYLEYVKERKEVERLMA